MGQVVYVRHGQASLFSDNYDQLSPLGHRQSKEIGFYFSKKDTRWLVPRPNPTLGWTFNLGTKKGALAMLLSFLIPILLLTGVLLIFVLLSTTKC